ncbi:MAG: hypothetical protein ACI9ON_004357 [Limisphaerales bacterium]|jgi:hypothetical protein
MGAWKATSLSHRSGGAKCLIPCTIITTLADAEWSLLPTNDNSHESDESVHQSRISLIWEVLLFQVKVLADGIRDILLVPVSLAAAIIGLVSGGDDPGRPFRKVMLLGQRSEHWINLFGHRKHGTADTLLSPFKERVDANPIAQKAGQSINKSLDRVNERLTREEDN